jgi:ornithine decarboxylase
LWQNSYEKSHNREYFAMEYERRFKFLVCAPVFNADDLEGQRLAQIISEIERIGFSVIKAPKPDDAELVIRTDAAVGSVLLDWGKRGPQGKMAALVRFIRSRGLDTPIYILVRHHRLEDIPTEVMHEADGYVFLAEETPQYIAKMLAGRLRQYADTLKTPFFGALLDYAEEGNQLWTCPGHNGGAFYARSPIGRIFVDHLGEGVFRNDLDNSVIELGDLLIHEGPALAAQREAAEIFGAERTWFVLNGTSMSNKVVLQALVAPGDLVLFDRNNHKAAHYGALFLGGGIPICLPTDRNAHGLIGPLDPEMLNEKAIRELIRKHPLVTDPNAWRRERPFRVAVIEQCTYDGTIHAADEIVRRIGSLCDYVMFDEAWAGFMKFHPLYRGRFAMGLTGLDADSPGIFATQSTHKQLASFSQASQIHVRDSHLRGQRRRVEPRRLNEIFMLHASTSPFYPLFASLDVGAQMMKGRSGEVLWDDTIRLGIELRKKIRAIGREFASDANPERRWFFEPFVPEVVMATSEEGERCVPWEEASTDALAADARLWALAPGEAWHGFRHVVDGWAMTDPNKLTLLTPGFERNGAYAEHGVPAPVVATWLRENRIVPEKNDLNSLLFLLTPGVESSKAGNLINALVFFKRQYDDNVLLEEAMPEFVRERSSRYRGLRLRDLCREMFAFFRDADISRLQRAQFEAAHFPKPVLPPLEATQQLVRNTVDYVPISETAGRIATTLWVVYPPGIASVIPGERLDASAPAIEYLLAFERAANLFPGFESEIQGLYRETGPDGKIEFWTYVAQEAEARDESKAAQRS